MNISYKVYSVRTPDGGIYLRTSQRAAQDYAKSLIANKSVQSADVYKHRTVNLTIHNLVKLIENGEWSKTAELVAHYTPESK